MANNNRVPDQTATKFLDTARHSLGREIDRLRTIILNANAAIRENIKWNGPNYSIDGEGRITMRIHPPTLVQVVFHRGAKVKPLRSGGLIAWKADDRGVVTFSGMDDILQHQETFANMVQAWSAAVIPGPEK
jgi:hypothetical protein